MANSIRLLDLVPFFFPSKVGKRAWRLVGSSRSMVWTASVSCLGGRRRTRPLCHLDGSLGGAVALDGRDCAEHGVLGLKCARATLRCHVVARTPTRLIRHGYTENSSDQSTREACSLVVALFGSKLI
jgi:hypothetical protein